MEYLIVALIQARMSSKRLPGKVLLDLCGAPMLARQIERINRCKNIDQIRVAAPAHSESRPILDLSNKIGVIWNTGPEEDVQNRLLRSAVLARCDHVVRLTADCPLSDPGLIDEVIAHHLDGGFDYTSNVEPATYPDGLDVEVFTIEAFFRAFRACSSIEEKEHVTTWLRRSPDVKRGSVQRSPDLSHLKLSVDTREDYLRVKRIYEALYPKNACFGLQDILDYLEVQSVQ